MWYRKYRGTSVHFYMTFSLWKDLSITGGSNTVWKQKAPLIIKWKTKSTLERWQLNGKGKIFFQLKCILWYILLDLILHFLLYTTNPTERSTSKIFRSTSEIVLQSSVESQRALAECSASNDRACLSSARWDSTDDSKTISIIERKKLLVERSVGLVV